ncbi:hypothetical protein V2J94_41525 [Streptomyces sp. DSM 41524]|uniref:Uncharacterized protein n=1 Tax=Streptomyces asiaticus subsp. ignotus TaxID=3098222 RepID=A0ABU7QA42_9ACTN|nr:hypothetical protein [Streptomyces sp. DSM 41524]
MEPFAPLGRIVAVRGQKCGHSPGDNPSTDCQADATWHIMWNTEGDAGLACGPHMDEARRSLVFIDSHRVGPDCAMPGTLWDFDGQRCVYPEEPTVDNAAAEQAVTA